MLSNKTRRCEWCRAELVSKARKDARFCSQSCRQASHRFGRACVARRRASQVMRFAYADPPYPGLANYYPERSEVDHAALIDRLASDYPDGWALSTSARALPAIAALCVARSLEVRIAAWIRGERSTVSSWPLSSWEPVVFAGGRRLPSREACADTLICRARPRLTDVARVIGAKPSRFCFWLFDLLGALPGDELNDFYPGSGGVGRAWALYASRVAGDAVSSRVRNGVYSRLADVGY
jgi:hypothetical protein